MLFAASSSSSGAAAAGVIIYLVVVFAIVIIEIAGLWKMFEKANEPGWYAIIPILNIIIMLKLVGREVWWLILFLIPCVNIIAAIIVYMDLAKSYGKSAAYGLGMVILPFIFFPMLGFGEAQYVGPSVQRA